MLTKIAWEPIRCHVQRSLNFSPALTFSLLPSSSLAPLSVFQPSPPRNYSSISIWLRLSTWFPGQQNRRFSRPWGHNDTQVSMPPVTDLSNRWTSPGVPGPSHFPSPEHALHFPSWSAWLPIHLWQGVVGVSQSLNIPIVAAIIKNPHVFAISWSF